MKLKQSFSKAKHFDTVEEVASVRLVPWTTLVASSAVKVRDFLVRSIPVPARLCTGLSISPNDKRVLDANAQVLLRQQAGSLGRLIPL